MLRSYITRSVVPGLLLLLGAQAHTLFTQGIVHAEERCAEWVARAVSIEGRVEARHEGDGGWRPAVLDGTWCAGDELRTLENSRAALQLRNDTVVRLDQNSMVRFVPPESDAPILLRLFRGKAFFMSRFPRPLTIETPFVNAASGGTEYLIEVDEEGGTANLTVIEGTMHLVNEAGRLTVTDGQSSQVREGEAPMAQLTVAARDALEWALFYPPVLSLRDLHLEEATGWQGDVRESVQAWEAGDTASAFDRIDGVSEAVDDPRFHAYRASLRLSVGRVEGARADIARALEIDPEHGLALALHALIAVVQSEPLLALELALRAGRAEAGSASVQIALSYAWQANVNLPEALAAAQAATRIDPGSALAWARTAELWMAQGFLAEAVDAAGRAEALNPLEARYKTVLGFAHLTRIQVAQAREAFERSIGLNSADPLPRLGLGLAKIRRGDLAGGRSDIEIAAVLDPLNPMIRSYLGKAYHEEGRDRSSAIQLDLAKRFGPWDPTPYTYDAVRKQTVNRPVEAMQDIERSIELNDNRAPYRSRLLLDRDHAARSVSRGRIYEDLGFGQRALIEGWRSVNADPMNYSAHRFLADSYAALPMSEIARRSALLTSQLLQPVNHNPVQPSLSDGSVVSPGSGAVGAAFNEYTQLFDRNRVQLLASGIAGGHSTRGDELILSGVRDRYSWSLGQFRYETDGWRENADIDQQIHNAFAQAMVTPNLSIQAEANWSDLRHGYLGQVFDPEIHSPTYRQEIDFKTYRLGGNWSPSPRSVLLVSGVYWDRSETQSDPVTIEGYIRDFASDIASIIRTVESQYQTKRGRTTFIAGAGHLIDRTDGGFGGTIVVVPALMELPFAVPLDHGRTHTNYYLYSLLQPVDHVNVTMGVSYDRIEDDQLDDRDQLNPKLGLMWDIGDSTTLRLAGLRTFNRNIPSNQTIEPTQVAGFQQFFQDAPAATARLYGAGIDHRMSKKVLGGAEFTRREVEYPVLAPAGEGYEESNYGTTYDAGRAYVYWTPLNTIAASVEYFLERTVQDETDEVVPSLKTRRVPIGLRYYHPRGFFAGVKGTYVDQDGNYSNPVAGEFQPATSRFWTWDAAAGYRLQKRRGILSIGVENFTDRRFKLYQADDMIGNEASVVRLSPRKFAFARITLSFE